MWPQKEAQTQGVVVQPSLPGLEDERELSIERLVQS